MALLVAMLVASPASAQQVVVPDNVGVHAAPEQPLPFSHRLHSMAMPDCSTCHVNPEPGHQMTFPENDTCMQCHAIVATDKASIASLQAYASSGKPVPWVRVYEVTPGVTWSHRPHLEAGEQCETCHGDIRQVDVVSQTKGTLAMATCIGCHQARAAAADCVTCHAWPTDRQLGFEE
jgi:hypothetical protein